MKHYPSMYSFSPRSCLGQVCGLALGCLTVTLCWLGLPAVGQAKHPAQPSAFLSLRSGPLLGVGGKCVDILGGDAAVGTPVVLYGCHGEDNQQWDLVTDGFGNIGIRGLDDTCLVPGAVGASGYSEMVLRNCRVGTEALDWEIVGSFPDDFQLKRFSTDECLDVFQEGTANGTSLIVFPCHGDVNQRWSFPSAPRDQLLLPYFRFDGGGGPKSTLLAIRNAGESPLTLRLSLFWEQTPSVSPQKTITVELAAGGVSTLNLRQLDFVFRGFLTVDAFDPETLDPVDSPPIYADYFSLDSQENFASGGLLTRKGSWSSPPALCRRWDTRFLVGGGFSGGTVFDFYAVEGGRTALLAIGEVFDEAGNFIKTIEIVAPHAASITAASLDLGAATGVVEWTFVGGGVGHVAATYSANGRYSVSLPGQCRD